MRVVHFFIASVAFSLVVLFVPHVEAESFRPLKTQGTQTLKANQIEFDLAVEYRAQATFPFTSDVDQPERDEVDAPRVGFNLGLADNVEFQVDYAYLFIHEAAPGVGSESGTGDARIFTKWRFLEQDKALVDVALRFGAKFPDATNETRLGSNSADLFIGFAIGRHYRTLDVALNLGFGVLGSPFRIAQDDVATYGLAAIYKPTERLSLGCEVEGITTSDDELNRRTAFTGAVRYQLGPVRFYLGSSAGLAPRTERLALIGGLTWGHQF